MREFLIQLRNVADIESKTLENPDCLMRSFFATKIV